MVIGLNSGLLVGLSGIRSSQVGLNVVGNNMANVNTNGYSRRNAVQEIGGFNTDGRHQVGSGSKIENIVAVRDRLADETLVDEMGHSGYYNEMAALMIEVEKGVVDSELSGIGIGLRRFFDSMESATYRPENIAARQDVMASAQYLASEITDRYNNLLRIQNRTNQEVATTVDQINLITERILELNSQVNTPGNSTVENLVDERYRQIKELSELVSIEVYELENNQVQIHLKNSNALLVSSSTQHKLGVQLDPTNNNFYDITLTTNSSTSVITDNFRDASLEGGTLAAKLQLRDGEIPSTSNKTDIPTLRRKLDMLAAGLIEQVNAVHNQANAYDLDGNNNLNFFETFTPSAAPDPDRYNGAAGFIRLSSDLLDVNGDPDPRRLALSGAGSGTGDPGNNDNGLLLLALRDSTAVIDSVGDGVADTGTFENFFNDTASGVGLSVSDALSNQEAQEFVFEQAQSRRDEVSAVSLDEEAVQLTQYQRAFQASSRFINVINQLTGDIISSLG